MDDSTGDPQDAHGPGPSSLLTIRSEHHVLTEIHLFSWYEHLPYNFPASQAVCK
jgi:hypothetical protein